MTRNFENGLQVDGAFTAGNMKFGMIQITPVGGTATPATVSGLTLAGEGPLVPIVTPLTRVPGSTVHEVTVNNVTENSFSIVIYRTNSTQTGVQWAAFRRTSDLDAPPPDPGGGGDPPLVVRTTKSYTPTWSATWDSYGKFSGSANAMYQGRYSAAAGGYEYSKWGFNGSQIRSDLNGATIVSVKWRMKNLHSYYGTGLTVMLGTHNNSTEPGGSSSANGNFNQYRYSQAKGSTKEQTIPNSFAVALQNNTAQGITLGHPSAGGLNEYGYFHRTQDVRLTITYDKAV